MNVGFVPFAKGENPPHLRGGTLHRVTVASQQSSILKADSAARYVVFADRF